MEFTLGSVTRLTRRVPWLCVAGLRRVCHCHGGGTVVTVAVLPVGRMLPAERAICRAYGRQISRAIDLGTAIFALHCHGCAAVRLCGCAT
jgi:hypothetical protein